MDPEGKFPESLIEKVESVAFRSVEAANESFANFRKDPDNSDP